MRADPGHPASLPPGLLAPPRDPAAVSQPGFLARAGSVFRRIAGMPDYRGYLAHMAERHAGCTVLTEREFYDQHVNARYGNGASRCC